MIISRLVSVLRPTRERGRGGGCYKQDAHFIEGL